MSEPSQRAEDIVKELFLTPEGRSDPYPLYHGLRESAPVHYSPEFDAWFVSTYDGVAAMVRDPRFGKNYPRQMKIRFGSDWRSHSSLTRGEDMMVNLGGPVHARFLGLG